MCGWLFVEWRVSYLFFSYFLLIFNKYTSHFEPFSVAFSWRLNFNSIRWKRNGWEASAITTAANTQTRTHTQLYIVDCSVAMAVLALYTVAALFGAAWWRGGVRAYVRIGESERAKESVRVNKSKQRTLRRERTENWHSFVSNQISPAYVCGAAQRVGIAS